MKKIILLIAILTATISASKGYRIPAEDNVWSPDTIPKDTAFFYIDSIGLEVTLERMDFETGIKDTIVDTCTVFMEKFKWVMLTKRNSAKRKFPQSEILDLKVWRLSDSTEVKLFDFK